MKKTDQYYDLQAQIDYLSTLQIKPFRSILFLGSSAFAKVALSVLKRSNKLGRRVHINVFDLNSASIKCFKKDLQNKIEAFASEGIKLAIGQVVYGVELPTDKKPLYDLLENLALTGEQYDCVIVQHSTYKIIDGGIDLVYGLLTRLVRQDGIAWCVIWDKECDLVRLYKERQFEKQPSDSLGICFAGTFVVAMKALFDNVVM